MITLAEGAAEAKALEGAGEGKRLIAIGDDEDPIKQIKIVPDVLVTGGGSAADGLMGMLTKLLPGGDLSTLLKKSVSSKSETTLGK